MWWVINMRSLSLLAGLTLLLVIAPLRMQVTAQQAPAQARITIASGVRVRSAPQTSAEELIKLKFGAVVEELEQSAQKEKINQVEDYWYRVKLKDGKEGWVFGGLTIPFDASRRTDIYRKIVNDRLKAAKENFDNLVELSDFILQAIAEVKEREIVAELELLRMLTIRQSLSTMPYDKLDQSPYREWISENEKLIYRDEISGDWLLLTEVLERLYEKYKTMALADRIAWEIANNRVGGECEGDLSCNLARFNFTIGKYLSRYPQGTYLDAAIKEVADTLGYAAEELKQPDLDASYRADVRKELEELRKVVMKLTDKRKPKLLEQLNTLIARTK